MKILFFAVIMFVTFIGNSQGIIKLRSQYISSIFKETDEKWGEWSELEECNVLIVFDTDNLKLTVYSKEPQEYHIIDSETKETEDEITFEFNCIDKEGNECMLSITKFNDPIDTGKVIIAYPIIAWVYLVYWL